MFTITELLIATTGKLILPGKLTKVDGISIDSRTIKQNQAFVALRGSRFDGHAFIREALSKKASCLIVEKLPHYPIEKDVSVIKVVDTLKALQDIARFHRQRFNIPVIAITGSSGKTTTKEMLAEILRERFKVLATEGTKNNHIGLPLTLLNLCSYHEVAVLELGTNHFGEIELLTKISQPNIGIITNIGPAHLEYFGTLNGVLREKFSLIRQLNLPRIAILNADDTLLRRKINSKLKDIFVISYGYLHPADIKAEDLKLENGKLIFTTNSGSKINLNTLGVQNCYNALAAAACARCLGVSWSVIAKRLAHFVFPKGRLQLRRMGKSFVLDDTYNANPASLRQALLALEDYQNQGRKIVVLGDMLELGKLAKQFHWQAGKYIARICDTMITVGNLSKIANCAARNFGLKDDQLYHCQTVRQAQDILFNKVRPSTKDIVLVKGSHAIGLEQIFSNT